jgi:sulfur carrier protein ThiS
MTGELIQFEHAAAGEILPPQLMARAVGRTHPLKGGRVDMSVPAGWSIQEVLDEALALQPGSRLAPHFAVRVDGEPIPREWWPRTRLKAGSTVTFHAVPQDGNILKAILQIALVVAAIAAQVFLGPILGPFVSALTAAGLVPLGTLELNALFHARSGEVSADLVRGTRGRGAHDKIVARA